MNYCHVSRRRTSGPSQPILTMTGNETMSGFRLRKHCAAVFIDPRPVS